MNAKEENVVLKKKLVEAGNHILKLIEQNDKLTAELIEQRKK